MKGLDNASLDRLLAPAAITIVGASPNGHITHHLLRNLETPSCLFEGPVHLVNPGYPRLFDRACVDSTAAIQGPPGLVYLQVRAAYCLPALEALADRPDGVILFPDASREPGGYDEQIAAWGIANGVSVLGAQSNGLVSLPGKVHGLLVPVAEELRPGNVAVLAQSGGILGGIVKCLAQKQVGLYAALEFGTEAMLSAADLSCWLLAKPDVKLVAIYADGVSSPRELADLLLAARDDGKAVVLMIGGSSGAGRRAAASHSGAAAAPMRVVESIARQYGALLATTIDEFIWFIEALDGIGYARPAGPAIAVFSDSGGGGIVLADALSRAGVELPEPAQSTRSDLASRFGEVLNPFDFGSASMGHVREQRADVQAVAQDSSFGTFVFASNVGLGVQEQSVHLRQLDEFIATVETTDRLPFVACPFPYERTETLHGHRALVAFGSTESAAKLHALSLWAGLQAPRREERESDPEDVPDETIGGDYVRKLLSSLPLDWPEQVVVSSDDELELVEPLPLPVYVKTEAGLAHRARVGGVVGPLTDWKDVKQAASFLLARFRGPVSIAAAVAGADDYFFGYYVQDGYPLLLLGSGGALAETADIRPAPLSERELEDFAALNASPADLQLVHDLLVALQTWSLEHPWVRAIDLNPVVRHEASLVALDAKVHGSRQPGAGSQEPPVAAHEAAG
jgi:acetate---CoA ligase (ADP-forming)